MPEYRISPDQGVCPEGHPCHLSPGHPAFRECDTPHDWTDARSRVYAGEALVDVYAGPVGVEAFREAADAIRALMAAHEHEEVGGERPCPGVEVCESPSAGWLRAIQDVLDPLPREVAP